ncbi:uncharacterized protein BX663DRAFT_552632 [Cokeromyces recurvatus]|uniref:uncharacterized protein n=1 Tax=Cokeromyces recurvatus TaxID=90255 RepID=UPI002220C83A|nr:uncharacterized protein BX663DRAFT_552632 [Cokeromyces recurvatus]KAI7902210.1 hypothetical protein BX663DRAFT_552632 [Cokeromyces recurvatus]
MNRLPYETFFQIISYLGNRDLYQASYVCRYWNKIIRRSKLYETLDITRFRIQHNKMVEFFTNYKEYANTVKKINVDCNEEIHIEHIRKWPLLFPNVKELSLDFETSESDFEDEDSSDLFFQDNYGPIGFLLSLFESHSFFPTRTEKSFSKWKNLKSVTERNRYMYTVSMLKSNVFKNLSYLMLNFELVYFLSSSRASTELISSLSNAPALKHLCLAHAYINIQLLEKLHSNTPVLEILDLKYATLDDNSPWELETSSVEPALSINQLCLEEVTMRSSFKWKILDYVSKKYLNMERILFKFWLDENLFMEIPVDPLIEERIVCIAKNCKHIKEFDVDIHPFTKKILDAFDEINLMRIKDFFSISRNMEELINLSYSNQRNYIEHLNITISDIDIDFQIIIHRFTNLKTISLSFCPHHLGPGQDQGFVNFPFNSFLNQHPNVIHLKLHSFFISLHPIFPQPYYNLDRLELYGATIPEPAEENLSYLLRFISQSCPKLKLFALSIKSLRPIINPEDISMDLSRHDIHTLNIFIKGYPYIKLHDLQGHCIWYSIRKQHSIGSAAYIKLKVEPRKRRATRSNPDTGTISIKCKNVENIILPTGNGYGFIYHL